MISLKKRLPLPSRFLKSKAYRVGLGSSRRDNPRSCFAAVAPVQAYDHICRVLQTTGWRIEGPQWPAVRLGLNPSTLRAQMREYGIRGQ
jgi:transcriptional regulator with GAF, ATPase, and Fis domain